MSHVAKWVGGVPWIRNIISIDGVHQMVEFNCITASKTKPKLQERHFRRGLSCGNFEKLLPQPLCERLFGGHAGGTMYSRTSGAAATLRAIRTT